MACRCEHVAAHSRNIRQLGCLEIKMKWLNVYGETPWSGREASDLYIFQVPVLLLSTVFLLLHPYSPNMRTTAEIYARLFTIPRDPSVEWTSPSASDVWLHFPFVPVGFCHHP